MSYATVADHPTLTQASLDSATVYLDAVYASRYPGTIADGTQDDLWPRTGAIHAYRKTAIADIPTELERACVIAAEKIQAGEVLMPDTVPSATSASTQGRDITERTVTDGEGRVTTKWSTAASSTSTNSNATLTDQGLPIIPSIDALMLPLLGTSSTGTSNYYLNRA